MISRKKIEIKFLFLLPLLLLVIFCVFVPAGDAKVRCIEKERKALLSFKNGLINDPDSLSSWQSDECCEWYGVTCNNATAAGHVITLQLSDAGLHGDSEARCIESEREALLSFKNGLIDEDGILSSWKSNECCEWHGVGCSTTTSHVTALKLRGLDNGGVLKGDVHSSLLELHHLNRLDLSHNDFGGIPIPEFIGSMKQLQHLFLSYSNFTGSIPLSIGQLSELQVLDLSYNSLEGLVSASHFIKLDKLKTLDLSFNSLILDISLDWSPPFQLESLSLGRSNVGPYFPKWIRTQRNLISLDLSRANITDEAPRWLWSTFSSLGHLDLSGNQISGALPNLSSTSIRYIDLRNNQFSGPIPLFSRVASDILLSGNMLSGSISSICQTSNNKLQTLILSNNHLSGEVPDCWENMPNLESLDLANNNFSGEIPRSFGNLDHLVVLQIRDNHLSGELPYNLRFCLELYLIDIEGNKLTGEIPTWIGELHNLRYLNFRGNKLHGIIPPQICHLTNIRVLDLSINNLSSKIPDCFNNYTLLKIADYLDPYLSAPIYPNSTTVNEYYGYSSFQWKGKEFECKNNLNLLKLIDFSSNRLTGNIPKSISGMRGLKSLNLSRNSLTGYIIPDVGKLEMLNSLDLSHNQLSGKIPTSLGEVYSLGVLDLSNNNFSGKIPTSTQLQSFNASAYASNDGLCGEPLPKCLQDSLMPSLTNPGGNMNERDGNNFSFMEEVGISMAFGFIFGFWGIVGSLIMKKSWRIAFFNLSDAAANWFYVKIVVFVSKRRRS